MTFISVLPLINFWTPRIGLAQTSFGTLLPSSATYEAAARAVYLPIVLPSVVVVRRVWWANGATTTGGATVECGIYADSGYGPGTKLISGSATQGTASEVQFVDVTDTALSPGVYWIAIVSDITTNTTLMRATTSIYDKSVRFQEASASPLPATATPAVSAANSCYLCGFATTASP